MADPVGKTILQLLMLNGTIDRANSYIEVHVEGQQSSRKLSLESVGLRGLSAREVVQALQPEVNTDAKFIEYIKGEDGKDAFELAQEGGFNGTREQWLAQLQGADGASAFDIAVENGYVGNEAQFAAGLNSAVTSIAGILESIEEMGTVATAQGQRLTQAEQTITTQGQTLTGHTQTLTEHGAALTTQGQTQTAQGQAISTLQSKTNHVQANKDPDVVPTFVGQQWLNTATGANFEAKGLLIGDWVAGVIVSSTGKISSQLIPGQMTLTTSNKDWPHPSVYLKARLVSGGNTSIRFLDQNNTDLGTFELDEAIMRSSDQLTGLAGGLRYEVVSGTGVVEVIASVNP